MKISYKLWTTFACLGLMLVVYNGCSPEEAAPEAGAGPNVPAPAAPKIANQSVAPITPEVKKGEPGKDAPKEEMKTPEKKDDMPKEAPKEETKTSEKKDETPK